MISQPIRRRPILVRIRTWVKQTHRDQFCPLVRFVRSDHNTDALQTPLPYFAFLARMDLFTFQSVRLVFLSLRCGSFNRKKCHECVLLALKWKPSLLGEVNAYKTLNGECYLEELISWQIRDPTGVGKQITNCIGCDPYTSLMKICLFLKWYQN